LSFDYESVTWGGGEIISPQAWDLLDHSLHLRYALEALEDVSGNVIEIGCGSGRFISSIGSARPDLVTYGADISENTIAIARARGNGVEFERGDAENLPHPDANFSAALMIDVLEHLQDVKAGLNEVRRLLRPGGIFHLVFPCEGNRLTLHGLITPLHELKRKYAGHIQRLTPGELLQRLEQVGFTVASTRYSYHLLGQFYDALVFGAMGFGFNVHGARRDLIESGKTSAVSMLRRLVTRILYIESRLLACAPSGMTMHVTCVAPTATGRGLE
jgi:ubiquinone/menaquinone biosynthesis C-methylase UbiE